MSIISKFESNVPLLSYTSHLEFEICEERLSTQCEDKGFICKNGFPNCVEECLEDASSDNQHTSDSKINYSAPIGNINIDLFARHLSYLDEENDNRIDLISICSIDGVDVESSYSSDFSSHANNLHKNEMGSGFKVYTNALYDEDLDDDQIMFCQDVQQGSLHGVINPLFE